MYVRVTRKSRYFREVSQLALLLLWMVMAEQALAASTPLESQVVATQALLQTLDQSLSWTDRHLLNTRNLNPRQRQRLNLILQIRRLEATQQLKSDLLLLHPETARTRLATEAEMLALTTTQTIEESEQKFRMVRPALFHNLLVNVGLKEQGFCWHWAHALLDRLNTLSIQNFKLHWGVARPGRFFEHNSVVITASEKPFPTGLVVDPWRHSGRPFWIRVDADKYPWTEAKEAL